MNTILITGASSGIGHALALEYARGGHELVVLARREHHLKQLKIECEKLGAKSCRYQVCDITSEQDMSQLKELVDSLNKLDIVVANAGVGELNSITNFNKSIYRKIMMTNVDGVVDTITLTMDKIKASKGSFAIVGSVQSYVSLPGGAAYNMSKFAIRAFAETLFMEMNSYGVSTTFIAPGFIDTEIRKKEFNSNEVTHKDPVPKFLVMPLDVASKKIVKAIKKRKRVLTLTRLGIFGKIFVGSFPNLFYFILNKINNNKHKV
jgi:short-subunit dehydrogenase